MSGGLGLLRASAVCWIVMLASISLDIVLAPVSWSAQWMDTLFVVIINLAELVGVLTGVVGLFLSVKRKKVKE
jgi:hypothetical protein